MQTFLPFSDFRVTAACLDDKRLGKQRVECKQILLALKAGPRQGFDAATRSWKSLSLFESSPELTRATPWYNHPATKMWKGFEYGLCLYAQSICREWRYERNFADTLLPFFCAEGAAACAALRPTDYVFPSWTYRHDVLRSHQSNLVRKNPAHYRVWFPDVPDDLPYVWPVAQ